MNIYLFYFILYLGTGVLFAFYFAHRDYKHDKNLPDTLDCVYPTIAWPIIVLDLLFELYRWAITKLIKLFK